MDNIWTLFISPFIVLIIGLLVEYWIIQPIKHEREYGSVPRKERRSWYTATIKALRKFRSQIPQHSGLLHRRTYWIEEQEVKRGYSIVRMAVSEKRLFWKNWFRDPIADERYEITIDRTGDILAIKPLPVEKIFLGEKVKRAERPMKTQTQSHPNPYAAYLYIIVGLLGGSAGLSASAILYSATSTDSSMGLYIITTIIGIALAILADIFFRMDQAFAWQRLPLAAITGFLGGWVAILIVYIAMIALIILIIVFFFRSLNGS